VKRLPLLAARALFTGFYLLSAIYCLLAYLPFTYHQVQAGHLFPVLDVFVQLHSWLSLAMLGVGLPLLIAPFRRGGPARWLAAGLAVFQFAFAFLVSVHPILAGLENNSTSLLWGLLALLPVAWLAVVDTATYASQIEWAEKAAGAGSSQWTAWCSGIFVSLLYAGVLALRHPSGLVWKQEGIAFGWSVLAHLLLFVAMFLVMECAARLAALFRQAAKVEFWLSHLLMATAICVVLRLVVWPAVGFTGWRQTLATIILSLVLASLNAAVALWLAAGRAASDGFALATSPVTLGLARSWLAPASAVLVIALAGGWIALKAAAFDWNYLVQKLTAAGVWLGSFAAFYGLGARQRQRPRAVIWLLLPVALVGVYKGLQAAVPAPAPVLDSWAGYDASFLLARQVLTPARSAEQGFFEFLNRNTNIPASVRVDPVPVELAEGRAPSPQPAPHIFIFTIDSLRRDYVSAYNAKVQFTPSIGAFARESTVFNHAFTRYGGTGLSEPAIWSGTLLLHKQYITPFASMNSLEKLVTAERYQVFISRDSILQTLLTPSAATVDLDPGEATMSLDFARTIQRLEKEIDRRAGSEQPIFVYTQPQNLHISVIQRERTSVPAGESYPGFYAPYASRLKRVDTAFGNFIDFLKTRGLYDRSIIVLTADHGDSLGEEGRWGHAYTLFPEIVRIPLIVHLPENLRAQMTSNPNGLAFSTDITPSLYYLLGHRPIRNNDLFGSPLFTETAAERRPDPHAAYLLASSYGAVYGILGDGGNRLFVADGVNYRTYLFDLNRGTTAAPDASFEQEQEDLIRRQILDIDRFYGFTDARGGRP
jgi:hypothetical protein